MPTPQGWWQQQTMQNTKASKPSEGCLRLEIQLRGHLPRMSKALGSISSAGECEGWTEGEREGGKESDFRKQKATATSLLTLRNLKKPGIA